MSTDVQRLTAAARELAAIKSPTDAVHVIRYAEAARVYARQAALGTEAENAATSIRLKAEIRLAETVDEGQKAGQIASQSAPFANVRDSDIAPATLPDLGITRQRLAEAREIASAMGPGQVDALVAHANEQGSTLSRGAVLREVRQQSGAEWGRTLERAQTPESSRRAAVLEFYAAAQAVGERWYSIDPPLRTDEYGDSFVALRSVLRLMEQTTEPRLEVVR